MNIVNNVLDLTSIEAGNFRLSENDVSISENLRICREVLDADTSVRACDLRTSMPETLPTLRVDENAIRRVLLNVLKNALTFSPGHTAVELTIRIHETTGFMISIRGQGIGMNAEEIELALRPFGQIDNELNRQFEGTGLGLPLSKALMTLHGGDLQIRSKPSVGTVIELLFPPERVVWTNSHSPEQLLIAG